MGLQHRILPVYCRGRVFQHPARIARWLGFFSGTGSKAEASDGLRAWRHNDPFDHWWWRLRQSTASLSVTTVSTTISTATIIILTITIIFIINIITLTWLLPPATQVDHQHSLLFIGGEEYINRKKPGHSHLLNAKVACTNETREIGFKMCVQILVRKTEINFRSCVTSMGTGDEKRYTV